MSDALDQAIDSVIGPPPQTPAATEYPTPAPKDSLDTAIDSVIAPPPKQPTIADVLSRHDQDVQDSAQAAQFLRYRQENASIPPERQADVFRTAASLRQMGESPDLSAIEENLPAYQERVAAHGADWHTLLDTHQNLRAYLAENPRRQDLIKDDLGPTATIASSLSMPWVAMKNAWQEEKYNLATLAQEKGLLGPDAKLPDQPDMGQGAEHWYSKLFVGGLNASMIIGKYELAAKAAGLVGNLIGGIVAPGGGKVGEGIGEHLGTAITAYVDTVGPAYRRHLAQGASPKVAATLSEVEGISSAAIFSIGMPAILSKAGMAVAPAMQEISHGISEGLTKYGLGDIAKLFLRRWGESAGHAGIMIGTVAGVSQGLNELEGLIDRGERPSAKRMSEAITSSMVKAILDFGPILAFGPASEAYHNIGEGMRLAHEQEQLQSLLDGTEQSKNPARAPDEFKAMIAKLGQGGLKKLYAPIDDFQEYWKGRRADARKIASDLVGDDGAAYDHAVQTGGDLTIPVDNYLATLGKTEHARGLSQDLKISPDGKTPRQEKKRIERRAAELAAIPLEDVRLQKGKQLVEDWFRSSIERTLAGDKSVANPREVADKTAKLNAEAFGRMADEINANANEGTKPIDAWELLRQKARVEFVGQKGIRSGDVELRKDAEPAALPGVHQYYSTLDEVGKIGDLVRDENTGLLNDLGKSLVAAPEERPLEARFTLEAPKGINDTYGHITLDGGLRIMGGVIGSAPEISIPDAYKSGAGIGGALRDTAHMEALRDAMQKAVDPSGRVKVIATAVERGATPEATGQALGDAHYQAEEAMVAAKQIAERGALPIGYANSPGEFGPLAGGWRAAPTDVANSKLTPEQYAHYQEIGPEQARFDTYQERSNLWNGRGFKLALKIEKPKFVASLDANDFKALNAGLGKPAVNQIIEALSNTFATEGGGEFNMGHRSGDEYGLFGNDLGRMKDFIEKARSELRKPIFTVERPDGRFAMQDGVHFEYGITDTGDFETADRVDLPRAKRERGETPKPRIFDSEAELDAAVEELLKSSPDRSEIRLSVDRGVSEDVSGGDGGAGGEAIPPGDRQAADVRGQGDSGGGREGVSGGRAEQVVGGAGSEAPGSSVAADASTRGRGGEARPDEVDLARGTKRGRVTAKRDSTQEKQAHGYFDAFNHVLEPIGGADASPSEQADSQYQKWVLNGRKKGKNPPPFGDSGYFDAVNEELERKPGNGVSGALEAMYELGKKFRTGTNWEKLQRVIDVMKQVPGLEKISLPESVLKRIETAKYEAAAAEHYGVKLKQPKQEGELPQNVKPVPKTETPAFKAWFGDSKAVDASGKPLTLYHGAQRPDRIGDRFRKSRATSGPMAFFTDDPGIASNYATGKSDTSLQAPDDYSGWFKFKVGRSSVSIDRAWYFLTPEKRAEVAAKLPKVSRVVDTSQGYEQHTDEFKLGDEYGLADKGHWDWEIREARGNVLKAAVETWLNSGALFDEEELFTKVLKAAGVSVEFDHPHASYSAVIPVHLSIKNPLVTSEIPDSVVEALDKASRRVRAKVETSGVDPWDKRAISASDWMQQLREDLQKGTDFTWVRVPDWVTKTLKSLGYDGIRDVGGKGGGSKHSVWIPFEETQVKSASGNRGTFDPNDPSILRQPGDRGSIQFELPDGTGGRRRYTIDLTGADESTAAHETFHMLTEVLHDVATAPNAPPALKANYEELIKWMGHASPEERVANTKERIALERKANSGKLTPTEEKRRLELEAKEERGAVGWEHYLMEGKSPNARLEDVFSRFGAWLTKIYRAGNPSQQFAEKYGEQLGLTPEVRAIFDRLLATDSQIEATKNALEMQPLPLTYTPEEQAEHDKLTEEIQSHARSVILQAFARDRDVKLHVVDEERDKLTEQANSDLDRQPVYRALSFLQERNLIVVDPDTGELSYPEPPDFLKGENGKTVRMDRKAVDEALGKGGWKTLPAGTTDAKGGVSPGEIADFFGFDSSEALLRSLQKAEPRNRAVERDVQNKLTEMFGPSLLDDPSKLFDEAVAAEHSDAAAKRIMLEIRSMRRQLNKDIDPRLEAVADRSRKETAKRLIDERQIQDLDPNYYRRAEQGNAKRALEAAIAGKIEKAMGERETQLLNQQLYRYARDAKAESDNILTQLSKKNSDSYRAAMGRATIDEKLEDGTIVQHRDYLKAHDAIMFATGIGKIQPSDFKLDDLLARMNAEASDVDFDVDTIRDILANPKPFKELTTPQAAEVYAAIRNIKASANSVLDILVDGERTTVKSWVDKIIGELELRKNLGGAVSDKTQVGNLHKLAVKIQGIDGGLLDATMFDMMGPTSKQFFVDRFVGARLKKDALADVVIPGVVEAFNEMPKEIRERRFDALEGIDQDLPWGQDVGDGAGPRGRQWLWMAFLNMGNRGPDSNMERLLKPFGWDESQMLAAIGKHLTPEECGFLQKVLDITDKELWPEIQAKEERKNGLAPDKIKASPIVIQFQSSGIRSFGDGGQPRTYAGGYFPAKYDKNLSEGDIGERQENTIQSFYGPGYIRPSTFKSHTKKRVAGYANVLDLNWGVVTNHLAQVVHDIAFDEYVRDSARVLMHPELQKSLFERMGEGRAMQPRAWLKAVARTHVESVPEEMKWWQDITNPLRNVTVAASVGLSVPVAAANLTDSSFAVIKGDVSFKNGITAIAGVATQAHKMLFGTSELRNRGLELSTELRRRKDLRDKAVADLELRAVGKHQSAWAATKAKIALMNGSLMEAADAVCATQIFWGAFNDAKEAGHSDDAASKLADEKIRNTLVSHDRAEKSAVLRDREAGALLAFYSWYNKRYNDVRLLADRAGVAREASRNDPNAPSGTLETAKAAGRILGMVLFMGTATELMGGRGWQKNDEKKWQWVLRKSIGQFVSLAPFGGLAVPLVDLAVTGKFKPPSSLAPPALSLVYKGLEEAGKAFGPNAKPHAKAELAAKAVVGAMMAGAKLPVNQIARTGGYLLKLSSGKALDKGLLGVASGLTYGERQDQPANPFTAVEQSLPH